MRVDVQSLEVFTRLAREGAEAATGALTQLTGIGATVEVTRVSLVDRADLGEQLGDRRFCGVGFDFDGALSGETVLVFPEETTDDIVDALAPGAEGAMARSSVEELGNIMMSGFIDGWADHLGATIEHSPPEYVERTGAAVLPEAPAGGDTDQVFVFRSEVTGAGGSVSFSIYMLPEYGPLAELMAEHAEEEAIPVEKLEAFNEMTRQGTEKAADNVGAMAGIDTTAEVTQTSFCPIEDVPRQVGTDTVVGTVVEFTGTPSGYLLVLFDEPSAVRIAEALMPVPGDGEGLTDRHEAAIEELGNIVTSGFLDGWANVLGSSIEHAPPRLVHDMGRAVVDPLAARLGQDQRHAFVIDSTIEAGDLALTSEVYILPDGAELRAALEDLSLDRTDRTEVDVEEVF